MTLPLLVYQRYSGCHWQNLSPPGAHRSPGKYGHLGGKSPLLPLTEEQAAALSKALTAQDPAHIYKVFIAMRYWHPFSEETASAVKGFDPDEILLLPLYPQYSTATSASSFIDWKNQRQKWAS